MKKENYLEKIPQRNESIGWKIDDEGLVTLEVENKGVFNFLAQKLLKKPKISYIHLDEVGSFLWSKTTGESDLIALGQELKNQFGDKAEPLYERIAKYYKILESYGFIRYKK